MLRRVHAQGRKITLKKIVDLGLAENVVQS